MTFDELLPPEQSNDNFNVVYDIATREPCAHPLMDISAHKSHIWTRGFPDVSPSRVPSHCIVSCWCNHSWDTAILPVHSHRTVSLFVQQFAHPGHLERECCIVGKLQSDIYSRWQNVSDRKFILRILCGIETGGVRVSFSSCTLWGRWCTQRRRWRGWSRRGRTRCWGRPSARSRRTATRRPPCSSGCEPAGRYSHSSHPSSHDPRFLMHGFSFQTQVKEINACGLQFIQISVICGHVHIVWISRLVTFSTMVTSIRGNGDVFAFDVVVEVGRLGRKATVRALPLARHPLQLRHLWSDQILAVF